MGRRTVTYSVDSRNESNYRFEQQQKNLGANLGGVIFMCNSRTYHTCMELGMFGLPAAHWCYVQHIDPGIPLFLYNFETKVLHGIFKAAGHGAWMIDEYAWTDGSRLSPYPAQVQIERYMDCPPLPIDQWRSIIADNYLPGTDKFQQELTKRQATEMCSLFYKKWAAENGSSHPAAAAAAAGGSRGRSDPIAAALPDSWPGLEAGSSGSRGAGTSARAAAPAAVPNGTAAWMGQSAGVVAGANGNGPVAMDASPTAPSSLAGKTYAQLQEEEERRAKKAAKAEAKQTAGGGQGSAAATAAAPAGPAQRPGSAMSTGSAGGAGTSAAAAAAANLAVQQQAAAASAALRAPAAAPAAAAAQPRPAAQQQQQAAGAAAAPSSSAAGGAAAGGSGSGASRPAGAARPGVEELEEELGAMKATLKPLLENMVQLKMESELRVAGALHTHLARLDDKLMRVQKERAKDLSDKQRLLAQLQGLQQENAAFRTALGLAPGAPPPAAAARPAAAPAAAQAAPAPAKPAAAPTAAGVRGGGDEIWLMGGNRQAAADAGNDAGWLSSVVVYSPRTGRWRAGPEMPLARGYGCSGVLGQHLYVMGGGNSREWLDDCRKLDLRTGRWSAVPKLSCERGCAGSAALGNRLYAAGGGQAESQYDTVEIFNPELNAWMPGPKLRYKRFSTSAATMDGCVYVVGGYDGSYLKSAERLDPREGKWQQLPDMHDQRGAHACSAGPGGLLYAVGGYDVTRNDLFLSAVEAFDPRANAWRPQTPMHHGRAYGAVAFAEGTLWAVGGMQEEGGVYNEAFERLDFANGQWSTLALPNDQSVVRAFLTAAVVPAA